MLHYLFTKCANRCSFSKNSLPIEYYQKKIENLLDWRDCLLISVTLSSRGEGKIYLRKTEGIRDWFNSLKVSIYFIYSQKLC